MEIVNEVNFRRIIQSCISSSSSKLRLIGQYRSCLVVGSETSIIFLFTDATQPGHDDTSPSFRTRGAKPEFRDSTRIINALVGVPYFVKVSLASSCSNQIHGESLVLLPFGDIHSKEYIRSTEVFDSDRLVVACVLSNRRLLLVSDSPVVEDTPFAPIGFNIDHLLPLAPLISPATVHIWANGTRIFITDNQSDMILEFRFDYSLVDSNRGCPDFSLIHWYLESAIPIGTNTRVGLVSSDNPSISDTPNIQIISAVNNGDSQGIVRLVNQRRWFPSSRTTSSPVCSISCSNQCVLVNTPNYLKLIHLDKGPDFPITIRPPATNTALCPSGTYLSLYAGIITAFRTDTSGIVAPVSVSGLTECVDSFARDPVAGKSAAIIVRGDPTVLRIYDINSLSAEHIQFTFFSQHMLPSPVSWLSINQFQEWICLTEQNGSVCSNCDPINQINWVQNHTESFSAAALCDDWVALSYIHHDKLFLDMYALYEPKHVCSRFELVTGCIHQLRFESITVNGRKEKILYGVAGHIVILRRHYLKGTYWELVANHEIDSLCVLVDSHEEMTRGVFVDTTNPFRVYESNIESIARTDSNPIIQSFVACVNADDFRAEISWPVLPEPLRATIEPLIAIEKYPDTVRSTDYACRRYLIEVAFSREFPDIRVSTEALAWAGVSETQTYIVQQISCDPGTLTWPMLAKTGIGYWCNELGSLKTLVESMQKNALQDYMKSKDPQILEDRVAVWLSVLGKQQLLATLYKQHGNSCASSVHAKIGQFLTTDFSDHEHAGKAKKNAFELLRQKRYFLAVSMFILGDSVREALDVCCRQLGDIQLALIIAKTLKVVGNRLERDEVLDPLIEFLWKDRILCSSDSWMSLLYKASILDLSGAVKIFHIVQDDQDDAHKSFVGDFACCNLALNLHSAQKLIHVVQERMRRLNRHHEVTIPQISNEDIASGYLARGLPGLASTIVRNTLETNGYLTRAIELEISN